MNKSAAAGAAPALTPRRGRCPRAQQQRQGQAVLQGLGLGARSRAQGCPEAGVKRKAEGAQGCLEAGVKRKAEGAQGGVSPLQTAKKPSLEVSPLRHTGEDGCVTHYAVCVHHSL